MSARLLTDGNLANKVCPRKREPTDPPKLERDQMRLYSFYSPSLQADEYFIETTQTVTSKAWKDGALVDQKLQLTNSRTIPGKSEDNPAAQTFEVVLPRFSLDPDIINSYYPPDGHQDEARILPHIVFNDPHFPWEIAAGKTTNMTGEIDSNRSMVPWIALLVFDSAELHLSTVDEATDLGLSGFATEEDLKKQSANGIFPMQVKDYFSTISASARVNYAAGLAKDIFQDVSTSADAVNVIFPKMSLVKDLFTVPSPTRTPTPTATSTTDTSTADAVYRPGLEQLKYLAHVRNINTEGCPDAGIEQEGLFSVVVSARTGALRDSVLEGNVWKELDQDLSQPRTQIVHLVSIEHLDQTSGVWSDTPTGRIGLVSLHSWLYQCMPPNPINFIDTMRNLTDKQQMLRVDDTILDSLQSRPAPTDASQIKWNAALMNRLQLGYTLARWRTQTGEETTAYNRGPLVPTRSPVINTATSTIPDCSSTSQDYQILDPDTGLMDVSYSSAWQLGKLLAISDTSFSAALTRFRGTIRNAAASQTRTDLNNMASKKSLVNGLSELVDGLKTHTDGDTSQPRRARGPTRRHLAADVTDPSHLPVFQKYVEDLSATSSSTVPKAADGLREVYTGFNLQGPSNSDWPIIHNWLAEKLALGGIPPQYLIPEPSFCPPESLRFFAVDDRWLDCLIDGALSVANHLDKDDDIIRRQIKIRFNNFLDTTIPEAKIKPQIPCSGFFIRSKLIQAMPDLRITVTWRNSDARYPVCRWTKWDDQTLICLLDRRLEEIETIKLAQPIHQQRYAIGASIKATEANKDITFVLRTIVNEAPGVSSEGGLELPKATTVNWIDFSSRRINTQLLASDLHNALIDRTKGFSGAKYTEPNVTSPVVGIELNDSAYYFQIKPPPGTDITQRDRAGNTITTYDATTFKNRQLYIRTNVETTPADPIPIATVDPPKIPTAPVVVTPQPSLQPPNSQTRIQPLRITPATAGDTPTGLSRRFNMTVFADYKDPPKRTGTTGAFDVDDFIPTKNTYYYDLIFNITRPVEQSDWRLLKVTVDIPMQTASSPKDKEYEPLLTDSYDGPGVRMISNPRFIPFLYNSEIQGWVKGKTGVRVPVKHIELIPRSADDNYSIPMNLKGPEAIQWQGLTDLRTTDLSFRLAEASIAPVNPKSKDKYEIRTPGQRPASKMVAVSTILWTEYYITSKRPKDGENPASGIYQVVKLDDVDPKEPQ